MIFFLTTRDLQEHLKQTEVKTFERLATAVEWLDPTNLNAGGAARDHRRIFESTLEGHEHAILLPGLCGGGAV